MIKLDVTETTKENEEQHLEGDYALVVVVTDEEDDYEMQVLHIGHTSAHMLTTVGVEVQENIMNVIEQEV